MRAPDHLYKLIEPAIIALGYELVGIEYSGARQRSALLRIYIDKPGGIDVDDCARASNQVSGVLDVEDAIPGQYVLEMSSPGLDRPLFTPAQYAQYAGRMVRVRTSAPVNGRRNYTGLLRGIEDGNVVLVEEDNVISLSMQDINTARLVPEI